jgi:transposase
MRFFSCVRHLRKHKPEILNHCDYPIGTSRLEGVNNKMKLIKRRAYGYGDSECVGLKIEQAFPGKKTTNFIG